MEILLLRSEDDLSAGVFQLSQHHQFKACLKVGKFKEMCIRKFGKITTMIKKLKLKLCLRARIG